VIDDDLAVLTVLARVLVRDHDVVALQSPRSALQRIAAGERFDVIVSDLDMPEMSGPELFDEIRRLAPEQHARIIAVTGSLAPPALDVPVLPKPPDYEALRALIRARLLAQARQSDAARSG
jgi:CheY-like chemotaxis protein